MYQCAEGPIGIFRALGLDARRPRETGAEEFGTDAKLS